MIAWGGLCGYSYYGNFNACRSTASVTGNNSVGGFSGQLYYGTIEKSYTTGTVTGNSYPGGFCGRNDYAQVYNSYATGAVNGGSTAGGFCGYLYKGRLEQCYSTGAVSGSSAGGFCGYRYYSQTYVLDCFWDKAASGLTTSAGGGTGKTTEEMQTESTFTGVGWDFSSIWYMKGYPALQTFGIAAIESIVIDGPAEVNEKSVTNFTCTATYDDSSTMDVTGSVEWFVTPPETASITSGLFRAGILSGNTNCTLTAVYQSLTNSVSVNLIETYPNLVSLEITGPAQVQEHSTSNFTCTATYDDEGTADVSASAEWDLDLPSLASISGGALTVGTINGSTNCQLSASLDGIEDNLNVTFVETMLNLVSLEITGPDTVLENSASNYTCIATYNDGSTSNVTTLVNWDENSSFTTINNEGVLTASDVLFDRSVTLSALYSAGNEERNDTHNITVKALLTTGVYSGGTGNELDPYQISTLQDLLDLGDHAGDYDKCFVLTTDIDLSGTNFTKAIIAPDLDDSTTSFRGQEFSGCFDGGGYTISNLVINTDAGTRHYLGLFGYLTGTSGTIKNLSLKNASITSGSSSMYMGGVCGYNSFSTITNCNSTAYITTENYSSYAGGICGANHYGKIVCCTSSSNVDGYNYTGSLCGINYGEINLCYAEGTVSGNTYLGGLCGFNSIGSISNSYASGGVSGSSYIGGFCGYNNNGAIADCYSTGSVSGNSSLGGFCGYSTSASLRVQDCFWDKESSVYLFSSGGTGKTTLQMKTQSTFTGWNFSDTWYMDEYPALRCFYSELESITTTGPLSIDEQSVSNYICTATYSDSSTQDVTSIATWSVEPADIALISEGVLTTLTALNNTNCTITAVYQNQTNSFAVTIIDSVPDLESIEITGPSQINENSISNYTCIAHFDDSSTADVTDIATWSVDPDGLASISSGQLTTGPISENTNCTLRVVYQGLDDDLPVTIINGIPLLQSVVISGPAQVNENSNSNFTCTAHYDDNTTADVTESAEWNFDPSSLASVTNGELNVGSVTANTNGIITASYEGKTNDLQVTMLDLGRDLTAIEISGPPVLIEGSTTNYTCTAIYNDSSSADVTSTALWSEDSQYAAFTAGGLLSSDPVTNNQQVILSAVYTERGIERSDTYAVTIHNIYSYGGGAGTELNPYQIATREQLLYLSTNANHYSKDFILVADIDMSGAGRVTALIAPDIDEATIEFQGTKFSGTFNGNGHIIRNLTIGAQWGGQRDYHGMFGAIDSSGIVRKLGLEDVSIVGVSGANYAGALCGENSGIIDQCFSTGLCTLSNIIGGLCGANNGSINNCYSTVDVSGYQYAAGLCAINQGSVSNCFAAGSVTGTYSDYGLCGGSAGTVIDSFWDRDTTGQSLSQGGGIGWSTSLMQMTPTFTSAGWDFLDEAANGSDDIWYMKAYPALTCFGVVSYTEFQIQGVAVVEDNSVTEYQGMVRFSDNSTYNATEQATWSVDNPAVASIASGALTTGNALSNTLCTITASYNGQTNTFTVTIIPIVDSLYITGPPAVDEHTTNNYTCTAIYNAELSVNVTDQAVWSIDRADLASIPLGELRAGAVISDTSCSITASFGGVSEDHAVVIRDITKELASLEITGAAQMNEHTSGSYTCTATYDDSSTQDVTALASWSVDRTDLASVANGTLNAGAAVGNVVCMLTADYGGKTDSHTVTILDIAKELASIEITGPDNVDEYDSGSYTCTAHYDDSSTLDVTSSAIWSFDRSHIGSIDAGVLTCDTVFSDTTCTVSASYNGRTDAKEITVNDIMRILVSVEISGLSQVAEAANHPYTCIATYDDASGSNVTASASWSVNRTDIASIDSGILSAGTVIDDTWCTVSVDYEGMQDSYGVLIKNTPAATGYNGGTGTAASPYQIATKQQLLDMAVTTSDYDKHFVLTADIYLTGTLSSALIAPDINNSESGFQGTEFSGTFDGAGYSIHNLTIDTTGTDNSHLGLFGNTVYACIKNIGIENLSISAGMDSYNIGGLCGISLCRNYGSAEGIISNCFTTGSITSGTNTTAIGGLIGQIQGHADTGILDGKVIQCHSSCSVEASADSSYIGGLCGFSYGVDLIQYCYANGNVSAGGNAQNTGGLLGHSDYCGISRCYATGTVTTGDNSFNSGGLCGSVDPYILSECYASSEITTGSFCGNIGGLCGQKVSSCNNCFSTGPISCGTNSTHIGGFIGRNTGNIVECYSIGRVTAGSDSNWIDPFCHDEGWNYRNNFFNTETSGSPTSLTATGKTTAEMQTRSTFEPEDIDKRWDLLGGPQPFGDGTFAHDYWVMDKYPKLTWSYPLTHVVNWAIGQNVPTEKLSIYDIPANDGVANLLKYASDLPATNVVTTADLMDIYDGGAGGLTLLNAGSLDLPEEGFAIIYYKSKSATGVVLEPIWCTNLVEDIWLDTDITSQYLDDTGDRERWKATIPADIPSAFIRLRATAE